MEPAEWTRPRPADPLDDIILQAGRNGAVGGRGIRDCKEAVDLDTESRPGADMGGSKGHGHGLENHSTD